jgi:hypothetical protein
MGARMKPARKLALRRETLIELTTDELRELAGGDGSLPPACGITVLVHGCPSDPRVCHYYTDFC